MTSWGKTTWEARSVDFERKAVGKLRGLRVLSPTFFGTLSVLEAVLTVLGCGLLALALSQQWWSAVILLYFAVWAGARRRWRRAAGPLLLLGLWAALVPYCVLFFSSLVAFGSRWEAGQGGAAETASTTEYLAFATGTPLLAGAAGLLAVFLLLGRVPVRLVGSLVVVAAASMLLAGLHAPVDQVVATASFLLYMVVALVGLGAQSLRDVTLARATPSPKGWSDPAAFQARSEAGLEEFRQLQQEQWEAGGREAHEEFMKKWEGLTGGEPGESPRA